MRGLPRLVVMPSDATICGASPVRLLLVTRDRPTTQALCVLACAALTVLASCASPARTATNFCRQLQKELPGIALPAATPREVSDLVASYGRLLDVAPLAVQEDWTVLTELIRAAAKVDAADPASVQAVADLSYASQKNAANAAAWALANCGVDISTGVGATP